jgi:hypothetical protein
VARRLRKSESATLAHEFMWLESLQRDMTAALKTRDVQKLEDIGVHLAINGANVIRVAQDVQQRRMVASWMHD